MKKEALVLSLTEYSFVNDDGQKVEGATVYILSDRLQGKGQKGYRTGKFNISMDKAKKLINVPCLVDAEFGIYVNSKNEPSLFLRDLIYKKEFSLGF